jgi:hypothetical protein
MPTNAETVKSYLNFALVQLAGESYVHGIDLSDQNDPRTRNALIRRLKYGYNDPTHPFIKSKAGVTGDADSAAETATNGSNSPVLAAYNRMVDTQATKFVEQYEIIDHHANDATGFAATLFRNKADGSCEPKGSEHGFSARSHPSLPCAGVSLTTSGSLLTREANTNERTAVFSPAQTQ